MKIVDERIVGAWELQSSYSWNGLGKPDPIIKEIFGMPPVWTITWFVRTPDTIFGIMVSFLQYSIYLRLRSIKLLKQGFSPIVAEIRYGKLINKDAWEWKVPVQIGVV